MAPHRYSPGSGNSHGPRGGIDFGRDLQIHSPCCPSARPRGRAGAVALRLWPSQSGRTRLHGDRGGRLRVNGGTRRRGGRPLHGEVHGVGLTLADSGILTAACQPESGRLEITSVRFDTAEAAHSESDDLTHGRAVDARNVSLETSCDTGAPSLFPERGLVLGTFEERVDGVAVTGFGVMAEDGTFTALSPDHGRPRPPRGRSGTGQDRLRGGDR